MIGEHMDGCADRTCPGVGIGYYDGCTRPDAEQAASAGLPGWTRAIPVLVWAGAVIVAAGRIRELPLVGQVLAGTPLLVAAALLMLWAVSGSGGETEAKPPVPVEPPAAPVGPAPAPSGAAVRPLVRSRG